MYSGGENAYPFNTIATPAPRGHLPQMSNKKQGEASAGYMLMKPLVDTATAARCDALFDVRVQSLVVEADGRVGGHPGPPLRQPRSPFGPDAEWYSRPAASPTTTPWWRSTRRGSPAGRRRRSSSTTARPSGWRRPSAPTSPTWTPPRWRSSSTPSRLVRGILVNGRGQRFVAEDTYPGRVGQLTLYHQDNTAYLIIDGDAQEEAMASLDAAADDAAAHLGVRLGGRPRSGDGPRPGVPAGHRRCLQRRRRARRGSTAAQEAAMASSPSAHRSVPSICARAPAASPSAACRPLSTGKYCTSAANRFPACTPRAAAPRASPHGVTRAESRSATAASTADRAGRRAAKG